MLELVLQFKKYNAYIIDAICRYLSASTAANLETGCTNDSGKNKHVDIRKGYHEQAVMLDLIGTHRVAACVVRLGPRSYAAHA